MGDVEKAERAARARAILFYLMAAVLLVSLILGLQPSSDPDPASPRVVLGFWLVMVALTALNLTPVTGWLRPSGFSALLDDESTRAHRCTSFAAGFWAALVAAAAMTLVASFGSFDGIGVAKVVITAGLAAALTSFATQELRAAR